MSRTFVQTQEYASQSVTQPVIAYGAVGLTQIEDQSVITSKIRDLAVTNDKLAPSSVTSDKIADGTVIAVDIAPSAVDTLELSNLAVTNPKLSLISVDTPQLSNSAVTNIKLAVNAVATTNITDSAVTNPKLAVNAVTSTNISDSAVIQSKLATGAVGITQIENYAITNIKLAPDSVTSDKIAPGTIVQTDVSDSAITNSKLAVNAVTANKILAGHVVKTLSQVGGLTLTDNVSLEGGTNILLETLTSGNKIRISNVGGSAAINLLTNGGFSIWQRGGGAFTTNGFTADRWTLALGSNTASISKEMTFVDNSPAALKAVITISSGVVSLSQTIENYLDYQNRAVAFTIRVRPGTVGTIVAKITDSNGSTSSAANTGTASYETLSVTRTPAVGITSLTFSIEISASQTCYVDGAMAVQNADPLTFAALSPAEDWGRSQRYFEVGYNDFSKYGASDDTTYYIDDDIDFNVVKASAPVIALTNVQIYEDGLGITNAVAAYTLLLGITDHLLRGFSLRASKSIGGQRPVRMAFNWTATS